MSRTPPPAPTAKALAGLEKYRQQVSQEKLRDIEKALADLRKTNATITVSAVAARAGVTRKTVHKHDHVMAIIAQYRHHRDTQTPPATGRETSIVTALRNKLAARDKEVADLKATVAQQKATIELLYGQLEARYEQNT
ncbi:transposase [Mycobacterium sp. 852013-50091_SCH5140682]|uniref:DUF6262 family protein n=1 Tax=Mycobacterium sp. 852013-50091_SCH5140682 TaxID=1834109 RepID=UPI0007EA1FF6|nr:DUF6262 family protein [Mycobacterium sp. 852013-50091_SCH5140682]OBC08051.1 transposase [Mycobacterium sp. 852013-50091_SCH5140682]